MPVGLRQDEYTLIRTKFQVIWYLFLYIALWKVRLVCFAHSRSSVERVEGKLNVDACEVDDIAWSVKLSMIGSPSLWSAMKYFNRLTICRNQNILFTGHQYIRILHPGCPVQVRATPLQ